ncbi:MAG TPA: bifunctional diaminohydroxyphosphoribosylaminopyrimidine deaminase/5-amino-6-(5-phosphoribosylamino)uracil reductase RibD [Dehalococcoidia bacterium]|nr:bifunctional diaminohydroxyphosphoribosylaminopyrimidine deaminase/5-amino-6-(5-phosphoribosylamino)uracil reductase RibD [Dehalococcoidia bacterium]
MSEPSPWMQRALALAEQAYGSVSPNPHVGCVIISDGQVVGEGFTQPGGRPHAEVVALEQAGERARGATAYVTLEPCSHATRRDGSPRTPCATALIEAGVSGVVFAIVDPDDQVDGGGRTALQAAGVAVEEGDGTEQASRLLEAYLKHRRTGLPFVIAKYAASLDGRIAAASGDSRWVSGPETLAWAHQGRTKIDAIMVGVNTIIHDDPQLTTRPGGVEAERQPLRVVVDSDGRIPVTAKVLQGRAKTLVATTERCPWSWRDSMFSRHVDFFILPEDENGRVSLPHLLAELGRRDILTLLVEGGGVLLGSFFDQHLVDKLTAVIAPMIVGAADAATAVAGRGAQYMRDAIRLRDLTVERLGEDTLYTGYPIYPGPTD